MADIEADEPEVGLLAEGNHAAGHQFQGAEPAAEQPERLLGDHHGEDEVHLPLEVDAAVHPGKSSP